MIERFQINQRKIDMHFEIIYDIFCTITAIIIQIINTAKINPNNAFVVDNETDSFATGVIASSTSILFYFQAVVSIFLNLNFQFKEGNPNPDCYKVLVYLTLPPSYF